ncbi:MAG TPA: hypothetical protein VKV03_08475, partial [Candidatus Binataceae bacterium]|nr:hypothetical protein [Candidatus Binataceae bacterium]
ALASARPTAPTRSRGKSKFRVLVREVSLGRASINITRANGDTYALENSGLDGSVYILKVGLRLKLDSLWGHVSGPKLPPADIFSSLTYDSALHPASVAIDRVKIDTHDSHLKLSGKISDVNTLKMDLTLDANDIGSADIVKFVKQWSPRANLAGNIRIEGSRPDLHVTFAMNAADAKIKGDLHANLRHQQPSYRGAIDVVNLDPEQLLTDSPAQGVVNASIRGHGEGTSVANFNGQAGVRIARLRAAQWNIGDLIVTANIANQIAGYDAKIAQGQRAGATSRGRIDFNGNPRYQIDLAASHLDMQKLQNRRVMHTDVNLAAQIKGSGIKLADANAVARVNIKQTVLGPAKIDSGVVRASIARGLVRIAQASLIAGTTNVSAKGQVALAGNRRGDLSYNLKSDDLSPWMTLAGRSGGGKLQVIGRASGPLNALTVGGSASMTALQTSGISVASGKLTYALSDVGNDRTHGRLDAGFDKIHTNVDLKSLYVDVDLLRLHPTDVRILVESWDAQSRNQKIAAEVRLNSDVLDVSLNQLMLQMADGTWQLSHPTRFHKDAREISVHDLRVVNGQREITMDGRAAYGGAQDVSLAVNHFDLADLNPFIASNPGIVGILSTSIRITGTSATPLVTARMQIKPLGAHGYTLSEVDANANYTSGQMKADAELYQDATHQLIANATIPMELGWDKKFVAYASGGLNGRMHSSGISLAFLNATLNPRTLQKLDGNISMNIALSGPIKHPQASGGIWLWGGKAKVVPAGMTIDSLNTTVIVSPQAIYLQDLNARSNDGSIDAWGSVALDSYFPKAINLSLAMNN